MSIQIKQTKKGKSSNCNVLQAGFWPAASSALALLKQEASKGQRHTRCLLFLLVRRARDQLGYSIAAAKTQLDAISSLQGL